MAQHRHSALALTLPLLAFLLPALIPLLALPFENAPFNDDFSYARMARSVAATGTYALDGWTAPIAGPLAYYGAAFIKLFGGSHLTLRCATLLLAGLSGLLLYRLARVATLSPPLALQAALICGLSPVAIPLSASFMTDIPAVFMGLLAITLLLAAADTARSHAARTTLFAAMLLAALAGGAVRQTNWVTIAFLTPVLLLRAPLPAALRAVWTALWLLACLAVLLLIKRHAAAPYAFAESLPHLFGRLLQTPLSRIEFQSFRIAHCWILLTLPAVAALLPLARRLRPSTLLLTAAFLALTALTLHLRGQLEGLLDPYLGNMVTPFGILLPELDIPGYKPLAFPELLLQAFALLRWGLLALFVTALFQARLHLRPALARLIASPPLLYLGLFALATGALSLIHLYALFGFDRYFLPALPFATIALLLLRQHHLSPRSSRTALLAIALLAALGVGLTYDYHRTLRARQDAVALLTARGIPRNQISAGFELDAEAHLAAAGYLNTPTLQNPRGAYHPQAPNPAWPAPPETHFWFWPYTPSLTPRYLITRSSHPAYDPTPVDTVHYSTLFPLGHGPQTLLIQQLAPEHQSATPYLP